MAFIPVRSYDNYIPAHMMLQRLEDEGIRAYLQNEHTVTIDPILSNAIGGIQLMIYDDQLERAMELINRFEQEYKEAVVCPNCKSTGMQYITQPNNVTNWFTAITTWLFGNYALSLKKVYKCLDCGYESESLPG
jgi:Putative prokaryotic signal transducing protein